MTAPTVVAGLAYLLLAGASILLAVVDARIHRLPNRFVLPLYPIALALFALACALGASWASLVRAAIGGAVLFVFYAVLRALTRRGVGGGDVKLAGVLGIFLGWIGWGALAVGAVAGFVLGGLFGAILLLLRRATRSTAIPFGPFMIAGAWVGILAGEPIAGAYLGL